MILLLLGDGLDFFDGCFDLGFGSSVLQKVKDWLLVSMKVLLSKFARLFPHYNLSLIQKCRKSTYFGHSLILSGSL